MDEDRDLKRRYRVFVKANHPDAGGDRDAFERGLAALRAERNRTTVADSRVEVHRSGGVRRKIRRWWRHRRR